MKGYGNAEHVDQTYKLAREGAYIFIGLYVVMMTILQLGIERKQFSSATYI